MQTPFDNLLFTMQQNKLASQQQNGSVSKLFQMVFHFTIIFRVLYMDMKNASLQGTSNAHQGNGPRFDILTEPTRCKLSYFEFIEHINRAGRAFEKEGNSGLPLYRRIYFFRNKMIEHWNDCLPYFTSTEPTVFLKNKIGVPYFLEGISHGGTNRLQLQQKIATEFKKYGVVLPSLEGKWYKEYSDIIYDTLEKIDSELRSIPKRAKKPCPGIHDDIVKALVAYSFPTPIHDVDAYCVDLANWLGTLPV